MKKSLLFYALIFLSLIVSSCNGDNHNGNNSNDDEDSIIEDAYYNIMDDDILPALTLIDEVFSNYGDNE